MSETRVVHLKKDPFDVAIDRTTPWGNPFVLGRDGDRYAVLRKFRGWLESDDASAVWIRDNVHTLRGKTLGCWCAPPGGVSYEGSVAWICHGQVLAEMADRTESED